MATSAVSALKLPKILSNFPSNNSKLLSSYANHPFITNTMVASHDKFKHEAWKHFTKQRMSIRILAGSHLANILEPENESMIKKQDLENFNFFPHFDYQKYKDTKDQEYIRKEIIGNRIDASTKKYLGTILKIQNIPEALSYTVTCALLRAAVYDKHGKTFKNVYDTEYNKYTSEYNEMLNERQIILFEESIQMDRITLALIRPLIDSFTMSDEFEDNLLVPKTNFKESLYVACQQFITDKIEFLTDMNNETKEY
jgi:hypothetical protein